MSSKLITVIIVYSLLLVQFMVSNFTTVVGANFTLHYTLESFLNYQKANPAEVNCPLILSSSVPKTPLPQKLGSIGFPLATSVQQAEICNPGQYANYYFLPFNLDSVLNALYIVIISFLALIFYKTSGGKFRHKRLWITFGIFLTLMILSELALGSIVELIDWIVGIVFIIAGIVTIIRSLIFNRHRKHSKTATVV